VGTDGAPGADGAPGTDGADGTDGAPGAEGIDDAPATDGTPIGEAVAVGDDIMEEHIFCIIWPAAFWPVCFAALSAARHFDFSLWARNSVSIALLKHIAW
jgi:hypothetical protein